MKQKRQYSKYINKVNNVFCLYLLVTGEKRQRSESNDSDQSDEIIYLKNKKCVRNINYLNQHHMTYLLEMVRNLQVERLSKRKEYHQNVSLHYLQKDKGHIKVNVVY